MFARTLAALSVAVALTFSGSAAHAGFVKNVAKLAIVNAKADAFILKQGVKGAGKLAKIGIKKDVIVAKCLFKAAGPQPCI
jgi:hypothetical protein